MQGRRKVGAEGSLAPQYLADQLTLSRSGGTHYPHAVLLAPPPGFSDFATALYALFSYPM